MPESHRVDLMLRRAVTVFKRLCRLFKGIRMEVHKRSNNIYNQILAIWLRIPNDNRLKTILINLADKLKESIKAGTHDI